MLSNFIFTYTDAIWCLEGLLGNLALDGANILLQVLRAVLRWRDNSSIKILLKMMQCQAGLQELRAVLYRRDKADFHFLEINEL